MKSVPQVNPPDIQELPKQRTTVFPQVAEGTVALFGHRMPVNADAADHFVSQLSTLAFGTEYGDFISSLMKRDCFLLDTRVIRDRLVFNDDEDFFLHLEKSLLPTTVGRARPRRRASSPAPSGV